ncbi:hypothetical protein [Simiduia aestuariiviva]|uniref:DUF4124 domain-containing protein n=1 Tax=Simiduia aestuariiviva TaxID=1510459 RepID=A0A839UWP2_9GAMM|nr:hypothetical protein [Simiduia aestuariiviva]MBB3169878.1 hypothetical protein [Simiduia aestuariiviva]
MKLLSGILMAALSCTIAWQVRAADPSDGKVFYRYINEQGAKVMHHSLPPEAAKRGYEVVNLSGIVLRVVPPALTPEQAAAAAAQKEQQRELAEWDAALLRRYSSVEDIDAVKLRKLADLEANMAILISNLNTIQSQIRAEYARGADFERRGQPVPEVVLTTLQNLELELDDTREKYIQREWEYEDVAEKFEQDKERLRIILNKP